VKFFHRTTKVAVTDFFAQAEEAYKAEADKAEAVEAQADKAKAVEAYANEAEAQAAAKVRKSLTYRLPGVAFRNRACPILTVEFTVKKRGYKKS